MSESSLVDCPECGELVSAGSRCEECGAELVISEAASESRTSDREPTAPQVRGEEAPKAEEAEIDPADLSALEEARAVVPDDKTDLPESEVKEVPVAITGTGLGAGAEDRSDDYDDDCPHFRLEFNDARVFVQGWTTSFNFRLIPISSESGQCRMPRLEVRIQGEPPLTQTIWGFRQRRAQDVNFNFSPKSLGFEIASEVCLTYQLNGKTHTYMSGFKWDSVRPEESSKVIENLVIKMENVEAGMAADQNINILKDFKANQSHSLSSRLQDLKLKPIWRRLELYDGAEESAPVPDGLVDQVSLFGPGDTRLHLLGGDRFTMGRGAKGVCDIITMLFNSPDCPDGKLTMLNGVSRFQAHFVYRSGQWELRDGGIDPSASLARVKPSTYGTYLDGRKVSGAIELSTKSGAQTVTFGKSDSRETNTFGFKLSVVHEPGSSKPSGLLLERMDPVRESFLCLAGKIDFEDLFPGVATGTLRFRKGGFKLSNPSGEQWLIPGASLNRSWTCESYTQIGF